jgi:predicted RNase H-like HicB family nuclease
MEKKYCAFIYIEKGKNIGVTFPDFPGCTAVGLTFEEALNTAKEALESHIEVMITENLDIPYPKNIDDIIDEAKEDKNKPQVVWLLVEVPEHKVKRLNITLLEYEANKFDNYISTHKKLKNRSNFLAEAGLYYINHHP